MIPQRLSDVIADGEMRASLEAIRDRLAAELQIAQYAKDVAPLAKQLVDVIEKIDSLPDPAKESAVDELERARAARREAASKDSAAVLDVVGDRSNRASSERGVDAR